MLSFDGGLERLPLLFQHAIRQHSSSLLYTCSLSHEIPRRKLPTTSLVFAGYRTWSQDISLWCSFIWLYHEAASSPAQWCQIWNNNHLMCNIALGEVFICFGSLGEVSICFGSNIFPVVADELVTLISIYSAMYVNIVDFTLNGLWFYFGSCESGTIVFFRRAARLCVRVTFYKH